MTDNKPYLVDAVIGNSSILASMGRNGRLFRLWWPNIDTPQHMDAMRTGLKLEGQGVSWFDGDNDGWAHDARYEDGTNLFRSEARSPQHPVAVSSLHYAVPGRDLLVREYTFTNTGATPVSFDFIVHASFVISENRLYNTTMFQPSADALIHFRQGYFFAWSSANVCAKYQAGLPWEAFGDAELNGNGIDMRPDGAMAWRFNSLAPGESVVIPLYIAAGRDEAEALAVLEEAKSRDCAEWSAATRAYWRDYVAAAAPCPINEPRIKALYERSLLVFKLMSDDKSGSIIAAPEFDEHFSRCGGYSYCWGRDAAFITTALDKAGLQHLTERFYNWALTAQSPDGSWQQRHYHDGSVAPSWGLQIDEGASIIWGMWQHYSATDNADFARKVWPAVRKGADFLAQFIDEASGLPKPSIDLWEERDASHTYSSAAVYGGLTAAASFAELAGETSLAGDWRTAADRIASAIQAECWNEDGSVYYRGLDLAVGADRYEQALRDGKPASVQELVKGYRKHRLRYDEIVDISLLGIAVPFEAVPPAHERMRRTADAVERALTVPGVGGILRYEDDSYIGGNPWILTTLWLAQYRIAAGDTDAARRLLQWAVDHQTETGLLPEQIDKTTGATAWVVPLTWSHAMFVLTVFMLAEAPTAQPSASTGA